MIPLAEHLIRMRDRMLCKRAFRREQARLVEAIEEVNPQLVPGSSFEACFREDIRTLRRQLDELRQNTVELLPSRDHSALEKAAWQLESTRRGLETVHSKARKLDEHHRRIVCVRDDLMRRSYAPGQPFQRECDALARNIENHLRRAAEARKMKIAQDALRRAKTELRRLRSLVECAEKLQVGVPKLSRVAKSIDQAAVGISPAFLNDYKAIQASIAMLEDEVHACRYTLHNERLMAEAGRRLDCLIQDIAIRKKQARREIDLWLDRPEIVERFNLHQFYKTLTSDEVCRWLDIRPKLRKFVNDQAAATRQVNAQALAPREPRLGLLWEEIGDIKKEQKLEEFVRAAAAFRA